MVHVRVPDMWQRISDSHIWVGDMHFPAQLFPSHTYDVNIKHRNRIFKKKQTQNHDQRSIFSSFGESLKNYLTLRWVDCPFGRIYKLNITKDNMDWHYFLPLHTGNGTEAQRG